MRNISYEICRENQNYILCPITFISSEIHAFYDIMWKNMVEPDRPQMTIQYGTENVQFNVIQTHTQNIEYFFLFHGQNGYANAHVTL
jgi:hypothetical protein